MVTTSVAATERREGDVCETAAGARVLMISRTRYSLPPTPSVRRKFDAIAERGIVVRVLACTRAGSALRDPVFHLVASYRPALLDGPLFYASLPLRIARELRTFNPDLVVVQGVHETVAALLARKLAGVPAKVVLDVQGNWRAATRLYGSGMRRLLNPLNDAFGRVAVRRADAVRTIGPYTSRLVRELGVEPAVSFPTYVDRASFVARAPLPLPRRHQILFVGVLERYKGIDTLLDAWPRIAAELPDARLRIIGTGSRARSVAASIRDPSLRVRWTPALSSAEVAQALDESTALVIPSRMEGMGRVVIEAFARARPVIGTRAGGIVDLVEDGRNGLLVQPGDATQLAAAILRLLRDNDLAERLGGAALESTQGLLLEPHEWAERFAALVQSVAGPTSRSGAVAR
jgi:glycosyltransferase involved in cell wall biosynthesis